MCVGKLANRMVSHDFGDFRCSSDSRATFGDVIAVRPRPASPVTLLLNLQSRGLLAEQFEPIMKFPTLISTTTKCDKLSFMDNPSWEWVVHGKVHGPLFHIK